MHTNRLRNRGIPKLLMQAKNASKRRESQVTRALPKRLVCVRNEMVKMGCDLVNREKVFVWETPFQRYDTGSKILGSRLRQFPSRVYAVFCHAP
jgi:hypothetical protein